MEQGSRRHAGSNAEVARTLVLASVAAALVARPGVAALGETERVAAVVAELVAAGEEPAVHRLAALAREDARGLIALLDARSPSADPARDALLLGALARTGPDRWRSAVREIALEVGPGPERPRALRTLGELGEADDVPLAFELVVDADGAEPSAALEAALAAICGRDPGALGRLEEEFERAAPALRESIVRAAGASNAPGAAGTLVRLARREPVLEAAVLAHLGRLASRSEAAPEPDVVRWVRSRVVHGRGDVRRRAVLASGHLGDDGATETLVELLEADDPVLRSHAAWALGRITGLRLRPERGEWRSWLDRELDWWRDRAPGAIAAVRTGAPAAAVAGLRELTAHRHLRDELARAAAVGLARPEPELRALACRALASVGTRRSAAALLPMLEDPSDAVRAAAEEARRALVGHEPARAP